MGLFDIDSNQCTENLLIFRHALKTEALTLYIGGALCVLIGIQSITVSSFASIGVGIIFVLGGVCLDVKYDKATDELIKRKVLTKSVKG